MMDLGYSSKRDESYTVQLQPCSVHVHVYSLYPYQNEMNKLKAVV